MTSTPIPKRRLLDLALLALAVAATWQFSSCSKDDGNPVAPAWEFAALETQTFNLVNQHRVSIGLTNLTWSDVILEQARQHSKDMAAGTVAFGHDGFSDRTAAIGARIPWSSAGENVAMLSGQSDPATVAVNLWLNSPPHKANIEGNFNMSAMGIAKAADGSLYFTQIFIKSK